MNKPIFSDRSGRVRAVRIPELRPDSQHGARHEHRIPFSMQSLPQLLQVGKGFKEDVTSAPNTKISMRTQDEETARFFIRASAEHTVKKRTCPCSGARLFGWERFERGRARPSARNGNTGRKTSESRTCQRADADPHDRRHAGYVAPAPARSAASRCRAAGLRLGIAAAVAPRPRRSAARSESPVQNRRGGRRRRPGQDESGSSVRGGITCCIATFVYALWPAAWRSPNNRARRHRKIRRKENAPASRPRP